MFNDVPSVLIRRELGNMGSGLFGMPLKWSFNSQICQTLVDGDYSLSILITFLLDSFRRIR